MVENIDIFEKSIKIINDEIYYRDELSTFYKGNCLYIMSKYIKDKTIDTIITSPPYNLNIKYNSYKDKKPRKEFLDWMKQVFQESKRVLKDKGSLFLNFGHSSKDPWIDIDVMICAREFFEVQNRFSWVKSISINEKTYGQFTPLNSDRFVNKTHEMLFHFTKDGDVSLERLNIGVPFMHSSNENRWKDKNKTLRCKGDSWFIPYKTITNKKQKYDHPAIFPVELPEQCLKLHGCDENSIVLDMFSGTGTTALAARKNKIPSISIDIDENYILDSIKRVTYCQVKK